MSERDYKLTMIFDLMLEKLVEISIGENVIREINERRSRVFDKEKTDSYFFEILVRDIHKAEPCKEPDKAKIEWGNS